MTIYTFRSKRTIPDDRAYRSIQNHIFKFMALLTSYINMLTIQRIPGLGMVEWRDFPFSRSMACRTIVLKYLNGKLIIMCVLVT